MGIPPHQQPLALWVWQTQQFPLGLPTRVETLLHVHRWLVWERMEDVEDVNDVLVGVVLHGFKI